MGVTYIQGDVSAEIVQGLRTILQPVVTPATYVGVRYEEKPTRSEHIILNIQMADEFDGVLSTCTITGFTVSSSRARTDELAQLAVAGLKALPRIVTIFKNIRVDSMPTLASNDGQEYVRGFNATAVIKATKRIELNF